MQITLRKAKAVQNSIQEAIKAVKVNYTIELNEFEDPAAEISRASIDLATAIARRDRLVDTLYAIRNLVGDANAKSGIDRLLTEAALLDKKIVFAEETAKAEEAITLTVINGKLEKLRTSDSKSRIYGYSETVSTGVATSELIALAKKQVLELKKAKQKINDEVLELNIRTEITLPWTVVEVLRAEGLV